MEKTWFIYMIQTVKGRLYTGITTDLTRRLEEHRSKGKAGAKFFRSDQALKLVWSKEVVGRSAASKEEARIKKLTRAQKFELIQSSKSCS